MNFSVLQEDLKKGITIVSNFISNNPQIPILSNILFSLKNGRLRLCATNLEAGINYWLGVKIEKEGEVTAPAKILTEVISNLTPGRIDLKLNDNVFNLSSSNSLINIPTTPVNDFPNISFILPKQSLEINSGLFNKINQQVTWTAGQDIDKLELSGILFSILNNDLLVVATDGVRLSLKKIKSFDTKKIPQNILNKLLIPAKIITEIPKIFNNNKLLIAFEEKNNEFLISGDDCVITTKLFDQEKFPDFQKIIPETWETKVILNKEEIQKTLRLSGIFAKDFIVKFSFSEEGCVLSSENPQTGKQVSNIPAKLEGQDINISFNWRFINDFLNSIEGEETEFRFNNSTSPGTFLNPLDNDYLHLIMPIRTNPEENSG